MDLRETGWGDVEWIHLAQDRDQWRALVNAVMNFGFWHHRVNEKETAHVKPTSLSSDFTGLALHYHRNKCNVKSQHVFCWLLFQYP
jgi:hypothetical protein